MLPPEAERVLDDWRGAGMPFTSCPRYVRDLTGGRTNRSFLVEADGVPHVLRIGMPGADALGIDRGREVHALGLAAAAGLAPTVKPRNAALYRFFVSNRRSMFGIIDRFAGTHC